MRSTHLKGAAAFAGLGIAVSLAGCSADGDDSASPEQMTYTTREATDGTTTFTVVENPNGGDQLSYSTEGGMTLIEEEVDGYTYAFKDMNANGVLDTWEDWREDDSTRASALAQELSTDQLSGLMLFGAPATEGDLLDEQKESLSTLYLRSGNSAASDNPEQNIPWSNAAQAYLETLATEDEPYIPLNISSDPRSGAQENSVYVRSSEGISAWPSMLGLAATFDVDTVEEFARITAEEYRALGFSTSLSPVVDTATDPRFSRIQGTLGENSDDVAEYAAALVRGFQSSYDEDGELADSGGDVVATFAKHFPGDTATEGGRVSSQAWGQYGVFSGGGFDDLVEPFRAAVEEGALGIMTSYAVQVDGDGEPLFGDDFVGAAYNSELIDYIREDVGFDGVIVTDWGVTSVAAWGMLEAEGADKAFAMFKAGVDMIGGSTDLESVQGAYDLWNEAYEAGEVDVDADTRWRESAERILMIHFATDLFESPYVDVDAAEAVVASEDRVAAGFEAQLDSVVMTKNDGTIAEDVDWSEATVYIPHSVDDGQDGGWVAEAVPEDYDTIDIEAAEEYFGTVLTDTVEYDENGVVTSITAPDISDADLVLVGMRSPNNGNPLTSPGYDEETGEWIPISLQWGEYTADGDSVRKTSISGDILEDGTQENRSYFGNTSNVSNEGELEAFDRAVDAVEAAGTDIPIVVAVKANNPVVPSEFEDRADAIIVGFGVSDEALLEIVTGQHEPQGRLPIGFPASMDAVEAQLEDVGMDMETYVDSAGNDWAYGFGLNWSGVIQE